MKLLKVIEKPLKDWHKTLGKRPINEMWIREPSSEELEKAIATCNINDIETLVIYN